MERELGRCFCTEECIHEYFQPTVEFMEEEWQKLRSSHDFSETEVRRLAHYRPLTLEDPDEVWLDQTETGERHFTFISHFRQGEERVSYIVICLAIDGVPSYVFLSFPTRDEDLVDEYRRGLDVKVSGEPEAEVHEATELGPPAPETESDTDSEDGSPSSEKNLPSGLEQLHESLRHPTDIPREAFAHYDEFIEPTIDEPDEIWRLIDDEGNEWCTFITRHNNTGLSSAQTVEDFTMIVVCEPDFESSGGLEVVFAFPTIDPGLVQHFRKGINSLNKSFGVGWARGRAA